MPAYLFMDFRTPMTIARAPLQSICPCFEKYNCYLLGVRKLKVCTLKSRSRGNGHGLIRLRAKARGDDEGQGKRKGLLLGIVGADKLLRMVAGATSAPLAQYIASPATFLHNLDPRVKQAWLLALVVLPARSHMVIRLGLVLFLIFLSRWTLPHGIWQDQLLRVTLLSGILFVMLAVGTDGAPSLVQMRTPPPSMLHMPSIPPALGAYSYVLMKIGPLQLTRKGLSLATTASCLSFTVLQSASLCLTTTTPEQLAAALRWYILPSAHIGAPVEEIVLTLLLALRFISLVFDEVRNIALGIVARGIEWKNLTLLETLDILFLYLRRIFNNLFSHAEQISQAMIARGFRGTATNHKINLLTKFSIQIPDMLAILLLGGLIGLAVLYEFFYF
ncbi:protein ABCI12, chloroplastic isoform X1 [Cryptomeria japonica]|uniref:protein ABCI12, chloroplastic isoform X1 n=2 Tax=Cryptomeria japonica TaxID=3369 RepID=UPI0027D9DFFE|nr:protein ABCI12, chloroplastic isoform X1 [Cryptomeria japonica]